MKKIGVDYGYFDKIVLIISDHILKNYNFLSVLSLVSHLE